MKNLKIKKERRKLIKVFGFKSNWRDLNGNIIIKKSRIRLPLIIKKKNKLIVLNLVRRNKLRSKIVKRFKFGRPKRNLKTLVPKRLYRKRRRLKKTLAKKLKRLIHRKKRLRLKNFLKFRNKFFEKKPVYDKSYLRTKKFASKLWWKFRTKKKYMLLNSIKGVIKNNNFLDRKIKIKKLKLKDNENHWKSNRFNKKKWKKYKLKGKRKIIHVTLTSVNNLKKLDLCKKLNKTKANVLNTLRRKFAFGYRGARILMHRSLRKILRKKSFSSFPLLKFRKKVLTKCVIINSKLLKIKSKIIVKNNINKLEFYNNLTRNGIFKKKNKRIKKLKIKKWIKMFIKNNRLYPFFFFNVLKSLHLFKISKKKRMIKWNLNCLKLLKNINSISVMNKKNFLLKPLENKTNNNTVEGNLKQKNLIRIKRLKILLFHKKTAKKRVRRVTVNKKNKYLNRFERMKNVKYWPWWHILWKYKNKKKKKRKEGKFTNLLFSRKRKKKGRHSPLNLWRQNYINSKFWRTFYVCKIKELNKFFLEHQKQKKNDSYSLLFHMERRILTFLFRINLFNSIYFIKQLIRHGFISISGKIIKKETYKMNMKDELEIITKSKAHKKKWMIHILLSKIYTTHFILNYPKYIEMNYKLLKGKFIRSPKKEELYFTNNVKSKDKFYI